LSTEERVLCLTTIDKDICDIVAEQFCKRQNQAHSLAASVNKLDKLQTLLFAMIAAPKDRSWQYEVSKSGAQSSQKETGTDESRATIKKLCDTSSAEQRLPLFTTIEAAKKRAPARQVA